VKLTPSWPISASNSVATSSGSVSRWRCVPGSVVTGHRRRTASSRSVALVSPKARYAPRRRSQPCGTGSAPSKYDSGSCCCSRSTRARSGRWETGAPRRRRPTSGPNGEQAVVVRLGAQQVEERRWRRRYASVAWREYGVHEDRGDDPTLHHQFRDIGAGVAVRHQHKVLLRRQRRKEGGEGARSARVRSQRTSWCAIHGRRGPGPPAARRRDREAGWQAEPTTEPSLENYEQGGALWARLWAAADIDWWSC